MEPGAGLSERPDPGHRLSDSDSDIIGRTWSRVGGDREGVGVRVLIRFFSNSPAARQYFRQFQHLQDPMEMQTCVRLRRHARRVMGAINNLVENLGDPDKLHSILASVGRAHALRHKVDLMYFKILNGVILEVLVEEYSEFFTHEAQKAWTKLMDLIYVEVTAAYREVGWVQNSPESHHQIADVIPSPTP